jgi:hypothetical protein
MDRQEDARLTAPGRAEPVRRIVALGRPVHPAAAALAGRGQDIGKGGAVGAA